MNPVEIFAVGTGGLAISLALYIALSFRAQSSREAIGRLIDLSGQSDGSKKSSLSAALTNLTFLELLVVSSQRDIMRKKLW